MKKRISITIILAAIIVSISFSVYAQPVSMNEAYTVAENWIAAIMQKKGNWGDSDNPQIERILAFKRNEKIIGYFCEVSPQGFILVSMRRELAPIKAYSARSDLDPASEEGLADLLKGQMQRTLNRFEALAAARTKGEEPLAKADSLHTQVEIDYRPAWDVLEKEPDRFMDGSQRQPESGKPTHIDGEMETGTVGIGDEDNYQEGQILLSSNWHQGNPYNQDIPAPPSGDDCTSAHCTVGCVATAGAQLMNYWKWPPYGVGSPYSDTYDWPNMADTVTATSPVVQIDAVAELSHEIGIAVGMAYCLGRSSPCASTSSTADMESVYENQYRYSNVYRRNRSDYTAVNWFELMKEEFNWNRPVQYRITGHSIVGDGWQEIGSPVVREYHMNYGWSGTGSDTWYTLDALTADPSVEEYLLENIRPEPYMMDLSATYPRASFPYRYFYRDTWGSGGIFEGGQRLQFLPGIFVYATSGAPVVFQGSAIYYSYLFSEGDLSRGIKIRNNANAAIKMYNYGGIKFSD